MDESGPGSGAPTNATRYEQFRDPSGSWTFDVREYERDLNSISGVDISSDPDPDEAYRAAVFLEGFIRDHKATSDWSDDALDRFTVFDSTAELEAVAKFLRDVADR